MKEWQVEDAGGGCRAFSEVVVLVCEQTGEIYSSLLPITWEDGSSLEEKACSLLLSLIKQARVQKEDHLRVCSGNIFHAFHSWLDENGYQWKKSKIDGMAHDVAEELFHRQVVDAGFPPEIRLVERNYRDYYRVIEKWVAEDPLLHSYFKDYEARRKPAETRYTLRSNGSHTRTCMGCRKKILPFTPVVTYRCRENGRKIRRYFHPDCTPVDPLKSTLERRVVHWNAVSLEGVIVKCGEEKRICAVCGQPLTPGERTFYGYLSNQLIAGHLDCFEKNQDAIRGA